MTSCDKALAIFANGWLVDCTKTGYFGMSVIIRQVNIKHVPKPVARFYKKCMIFYIFNV